MVAKTKKPRHADRDPMREVVAAADGPFHALSGDREIEYPRLLVPLDTAGMPRKHGPDFVAAAQALMTMELPTLRLEGLDKDAKAKAKADHAQALAEYARRFGEHLQAIRE